MTTTRVDPISLRHRILTSAVAGIALGTALSATVLSTFWLARRPGDPSDSYGTGTTTYLVGVGVAGAILACLLLALMTSRWTWPAVTVFTVGLVVVGVSIGMTLLVTTGLHLGLPTPFTNHQGDGMGVAGASALYLLIVSGILGVVSGLTNRGAVDLWAIAPAVVIVAAATSTTVLFTGSGTAEPIPTAERVAHPSVDVANMPERSSIAEFATKNKAYVGRSGVVTITDTGLEMHSLVDGTLRWRMPLPRNPSTFISIVNDTVLLRTGTYYTSGGVDHSMGIDVASGNVLWSFPRSELDVEELVTDRFSPALVRTAKHLLQISPDGRTLRKLDERSARADWTYSADPNCWITEADADESIATATQGCAAADLRRGTYTQTVGLRLSDGVRQPGKIAGAGAGFGDGRVTGNGLYKMQARVLDNAGRERRNLGVGKLEVSPDRSLGFFFPVPTAPARIIHADGQPDVTLTAPPPGDVGVAWSQAQAIVYSTRGLSPAQIVDLRTGKSSAVEGKVIGAVLADDRVVVLQSNGRIQIRKAER